MSGQCAYGSTTAGGTQPTMLSRQRAECSKEPIPGTMPSIHAWRSVCARATRSVAARVVIAHAATALPVATQRGEGLG